jgi:EpsI family protein
MGRAPFRLILLLALLAATGFQIHRTSEAPVAPKPQSLDEALKGLPGWSARPMVPIDGRIVDTLRLDDYINRAYRRDTDQVFLYVGYYRTPDKVGAAHDPLVCFPGQGWVLSDRVEGTWTPPVPGTGVGAVRYSRMIAQHGPDRQLLVYWFQAHDVASAGTLSQKLWLFWKKVRRQGTDNAFVRITVPV